MAFGAGVLISAVAFELVQEGFESSGAVPVLAGLVAGTATFYIGDWVLDHRGGNDRKRSGGQQACSTPTPRVARVDLGGLRIASSGRAPLPAETVRRCRRRP